MDTNTQVKLLGRVLNNMMKSFNSEEDKMDFILDVCNGYKDELVKENNSLHNVITRSANSNEVKEIDRYLNDLDNLIDTSHFHNETISDYTHYHKGFSLKQFILKGREIIRITLIKEKGLKI